MQDDNYATALRFFAAPVSHHLKELSITVVGNTLFTAKNFTMAPGIVRAQAMKDELGVSNIYSRGWKKLYEGTSTRESNRNFPAKYRTSEKTIVSAILELRKIKNVTIVGAMEWDLKLDIMRNFGIDAESAEMLPEIPLQPELGIDFGGANPQVCHSRLGFFGSKSQGKQKSTHDAETARLPPIQEDAAPITPADAELIMNPDVIPDSALPFSRESEARYALRSRKRGHAAFNDHATSNYHTASNGYAASNGQATAASNPGVSANKRRKTDHKAVFINNPIEGFVVDTKASPPLRTTTPDEFVRINAHRCESKIWNDSKYLSTKDQIQEGSVGECALGWKVVWIPEKKHWIVGREDEHGEPASFL
jgi:hypothetical protein